MDLFTTPTRTRTRRTVGARWLLLLILAWQTPLGATTLLGMTIEDVASQAELVFEGTVLTAQAAEDSSGQISTYVTFDVQDVLKGDFTGDNLELKFLGGSVNGRIMEVTGLRLPEVGERGVYFVESVNRDLVNPLLGWSQGHYLIEPDADGVPRVTTTDRLPITEVQAPSAAPSLLRKPLATVDGGADAAAGIVTAGSAVEMRSALTLDEFKSRIRILTGNPLP